MDRAVYFFLTFDRFWKVRSEKDRWVMDTVQSCLALLCIAQAYSDTMAKSAVGGVVELRQRLCQNCEIYYIKKATRVYSN